MFENIKKAFKAPETTAEKVKGEMSERHAKTEEEIKRGETERAELMEKKREEAERNSIEQAQSDLRELPGKIGALEVKIGQLRDIAKSNRESAYEEQFKLSGGRDRGAYEQHAIMVDFQAEATEKEKSRLEVKLNEAKNLLKSRGLLEAE